MGVLSNVLVQPVHVFPAATLAILVTKKGQPGHDIKVAGAA